MLATPAGIVVTGQRAEGGGQWAQGTWQLQLEIEIDDC